MDSRGSDSYTVDGVTIALAVMGFLALQTPEVRGFLAWLHAWLLP